jgi:hypothetical protein
LAVGEVSGSIEDEKMPLETDPEALKRDLG